MKSRTNNWFITMSILMLLVILPIQGQGEIVHSTCEDNVAFTPGARKTRTIQEWELTESITREFEIQPGENYHIAFDNTSGRLREMEFLNIPEKLPGPAREAINLTPIWLRENLTRKLLELDDHFASTYGEIIRDVENEKYRDEVAFAIAHTSKKNLQDGRMTPGVFEENARYIYENAEYLKYVNLTDVDGGPDGTYTTIIYTNQTGSHMTLSREKYYWFVVHPKISDELPSFVDPDAIQGSNGEFNTPPTGRFWREYLFHHNDSAGEGGKSNPLLKDMLTNCNNVWEAISTISHWVCDSLAFTSDNERAIQPVRIYRKHFGRCGEHQDIACAAARAALIPTVCTSNMAEDHVWNEFWDGRWVHWDANSYDNMDNHLSQDKDYNGGKDISTIWSWRGDGKIWSVTEKYTPTCTFTARVEDSNGIAVDGAEIWMCTENYYDQNYLTITSWGTTDAQGKSVFQLGNERNYWASADSVLGEDPADQGGNENVDNIITGSEVGREYDRTFRLPGALPIPSYREQNTIPNPTGALKMEVSFEVKEAVLRGKNFITGENYYTPEPNGKDIDFFICNSSGFDNYSKGEEFDAYEVMEDTQQANIPFVVPGNGEWYAVLSNEDRLATLKKINITIELFKKPDLAILSPLNGQELEMSRPITIQGTMVNPHGNYRVDISIDGGTWCATSDMATNNAQPWSKWKYLWNPEKLLPGSHNICVRATHGAEEIFNQINVTLIDNIQPVVDVGWPENNPTFRIGQIVAFNGTVDDNHRVNGLSFCYGKEEDDENLDLINISDSINGTKWKYLWNTSTLDTGPYSITLIVMDEAGNEGTCKTLVELIEGTRPQVAFTSPVDDSVFPEDGEVELEGTALDDSGVVTIEILIDEDETKVLTVTRYNIKGEWSIEMKLKEMDLLAGPHSIMCRATDAVGNTGTDRLSFHIDAEEPICEFTNPLHGDHVDMEQKGLLFNGTIKDNYMVESLMFVVDEDFSRDIIGRVDINTGIWSYYFEPEEMDIISWSAGIHTFQVIAQDLAGLRGYSSVMSLMVDMAPPELSVDETEPVILIGSELLLGGTVSDDCGVNSVNIQITGEDELEITDSVENGRWSYLPDTSGFDRGVIEMTIRVTDNTGKMKTVMVTIEFIDIEKDTDGDGIPDWWELQFGLDRTKSNLRRDSDRDGVSDLEEYLGVDGEEGNDDWTDPLDRYSFVSEEKITWREETVSVLVWYMIAGLVLVGIIIIIVLLVVRKKRKIGDIGTGDAVEEKISSQEERKASQNTILPPPPTSPEMNSDGGEMGEKQDINKSNNKEQQNKIPKRKGDDDAKSLPPPPVN